MYLVAFNLPRISSQINLVDGVNWYVVKIEGGVGLFLREKWAACPLFSQVTWLVAKNGGASVDRVGIQEKQLRNQRSGDSFATPKVKTREQRSRVKTDTRHPFSPRLISFPSLSSAPATASASRRRRTGGDEAAFLIKARPRLRLTAGLRREDPHRAHTVHTSLQWENLSIRLPFLGGI